MGGLALGGAACGNLPDVTTVKDLRVLAVRCEPAGFLVDLDDPGGASAASLTAQITALVVDPLAPGGMLTVSAVGCPDYIDTITSATGQGTKLCPPASATSQIPDPLGMELATTTIVPADMPAVVSPTMGNDIVYEPAVSFGLRPDQIGAFFSPTPYGIPQLDTSVAYNRDFSLPAIVNLNFDINGEHAVAIKNVVYWPRLDPAQTPNTNPTLAGVLLYRHRNADTGDPEDPWPDANPTLSISAGDKLFVQPDYLPHTGYAGAADTNYLLRVRNTETDPDTVETKVVPRELIRFQFYANAGTFSPAMQQSELEPFLAPGSRLHTDSEYNLPTVSELPPDGKVTIWVVTHDERAGSDWFPTTITVVP
jgi:hypothetical protein